MKKKYIITFDVHTGHQQIIKDLTSNDWHSIIRGYNDEGNAVICYLPETTWWKEFETSKQAYDEFILIAGSNNVIRILTTEFSEWRCSTDNPMEHQKEEAKNLK
ncbi:hypothetical protein LUD75_03930 [Epilithonimonas sp. JDS]|uniref:hypothetical protein n=1 Tax=Epilithonimonas sp. JDS TaxID=2902797 RepID=UPI001E541CC8|nr:hypothetical protein [Epilithonimonas sp. JDS]MCD9853836.1 hypothetical protein [Epilithonimonas sp. JDS]